METIVLASASPRRREILEKLRIPYRVIEPMIDENEYSHLSARAQVMRLATDKARNAYARIMNEKPGWIVGFDTLIEISGKILGKPQNRDEARLMLLSFSGKTHIVYTGLSLIYGNGLKIDTRFARTRVHFIKMHSEEIEFYLDTGEWEGAAGAYKIQERGSFYVDRIKGSYSNIVGLPISLFYAMLRDANYAFS